MDSISFKQLLGHIRRNVLSLFESGVNIYFSLIWKLKNILLTSNIVNVYGCSCSCSFY